MQMVLLQTPGTLDLALVMMKQLVDLLIDFISSSLQLMQMVRLQTPGTLDLALVMMKRRSKLPPDLRATPATPSRNLSKLGSLCKPSTTAKERAGREAQETLLPGSSEPVLQHQAAASSSSQQRLARTRRKSVSCPCVLWAECCCVDVGWFVVLCCVCVCLCMRVCV